jgi:hypothetical protein
MDLVRWAMWRCKPTSLPEERSCIDVVSNSSILYEPRNGRINHTCVRAPRGEWEDRLTVNLKVVVPMEPLHIVDG